MSYVDPVQTSIKRSRAIELLLQKLDYQDEQTAGRLAADLGDLYVAAQSFQRLFDSLLAAPVDNRDQLHDLVIELWADLLHIQHHAESGRSGLEALATELD